jgi:hypothetical protein
VAPDARLLHVALHNRGIAEQAAVQRRPLVEAGAERQDEVGVRQDALEQLGAIAAAYAERRVMTREQPVGHERSRKQRAHPVREGLQRSACVTHHGAPAGEDDGPPAALDKLGGGGHIGRSWPGARGGARLLGSGTPARCGLLLQVDGQWQHDGQTFARGTGRRGRHVVRHRLGSTQPLDECARRGGDRVHIDGLVDRCPRAVSPATSSSGWRSFAAWVRAVSVFVTPGPWWTVAIPSSRVTCAYA